MRALLNEHPKVRSAALKFDLRRLRRAERMTTRLIRSFCIREEAICGEGLQKQLIGGTQAVLREGEMRSRSVRSPFGKCISVSGRDSWGYVGWDGGRLWGSATGYLLSCSATDPQISDVTFSIPLESVALFLGLL